jgi:hypothetical protein
LIHWHTNCGEVFRIYGKITHKLDVGTHNSTS